MSAFGNSFQRSHYDNRGDSCGFGGESRPNPPQNRRFGGGGGFRSENFNSSFSRPNQDRSNYQQRNDYSNQQQEPTKPRGFPNFRGRAIHSTMNRPRPVDFDSEVESSATVDDWGSVLQEQKNNDNYENSGSNNNSNVMESKWNDIKCNNENNDWGTSESECPNTQKALKNDYNAEKVRDLEDKTPIAKPLIEEQTDENNCEKISMSENVKESEPVESFATNNAVVITEGQVENEWVKVSVKPNESDPNVGCDQEFKGDEVQQNGVADCRSTESIEAVTVNDVQEELAPPGLEKLIIEKKEKLIETVKLETSTIALGDVPSNRNLTETQLVDSVQKSGMVEISQETLNKFATVSAKFLDAFTELNDVFQSLRR